MFENKKYPQIVAEFYINNIGKINAIARKVKHSFYSIPLEVDDIILLSICRFYNLDVQNDFYKLKLIPYEKFFFSRIKYYMFNNCHEYLKNNHKILNNYIDIENKEFPCNINHYFEQELFDFLSTDEFELIYRLKVKKEKRINVARELGIKTYRLKNIEKTIIKKIRNKIS